MISKVSRNHLTIALAAALLVALLALVPALAAPQADPIIYKVYVTDLTDGSFVVSWTTDIASDGKVTWGASKPPTTIVTDTVASTTTHWVKISGLSANSTFYFQVSSGATVDNNSGAYYQATTGSTLSLPSPGKSVWGYMYQNDGTTSVPNAIVYLQIQNNNSSGSQGSSQWVTKRTDGAGVWSYDIVNVRTSDLSAYYTFTNGDDNLRIVGQGGSLGTKGADPSPWIIAVPSTYPSQNNIILNSGPTAVKMVNLTAHSAKPQVALPILALVSAGLVAGIWLWRKKELRKVD